MEKGTTSLSDLNQKSRRCERLMDQKMKTHFLLQWRKMKTKTHSQRRNTNKIPSDSDRPQTQLKAKDEGLKTGNFSAL